MDNAAKMQSETDAVVEVRNLIKTFRDFWRRPKVTAIDGLDLTVAPGRVIGLLGPNGSGKSTTIKILLGLLDPTGGSVAVFGKSPRDVKTKRHIGYLPEDSYLYPYLSTRETLDYYGALFELRRTERNRRVEQLMEMLGLDHVAHRHIGEFSKGMARRVGLAQALINDPPLLILDEPTSGLDPIGCRQIKDLILALAKRGRTIILSSHLLADIEDVCDEIVILYNGQVQARGRVKDLLVSTERQTLTFPAQAPDALRSALALLRERFQIEPELSAPAMNLEEFFLQVVARARRDAVVHSGVGESKALADFLSHD